MIKKRLQNIPGRRHTRTNTNSHYLACGCQCGFVAKSEKRKFPYYSIINNERGSVILLAVVMLVLLTIVGISTTNTSSIELQIVKNEKMYKKCFYKAEAGAFEAAQKIENDALTNPERVNANTPGTDAFVNNVDNVEVRDIANWYDGTTNFETSIMDTDTLIAATFIPGAAGSSIVVAGTGTTNVCEFIAHGLHKSGKGNVHIEIGFKTRVLYQ